MGALPGDDDVRTISAEFLTKELEAEAKKISRYDCDDMELDIMDGLSERINGKWKEVEEPYHCKGQKKYGCERTNDYDPLFLCDFCATAERASIDAMMADTQPESQPVVEEDCVRFA